MCEVITRGKRQVIHLQRSETSAAVWPENTTVSVKPHVNVFGKTPVFLDEVDSELEEVMTSGYDDEFVAQSLDIEDEERIYAEMCERGCRCNSTPLSEELMENALGVRYGDEL